jgi:hypothetical protein
MLIYQPQLISVHTAYTLQILFDHFGWEYGTDKVFWNVGQQT